MSRVTSRPGTVRRSTLRRAVRVATLAQTRAASVWSILALCVLSALGPLIAPPATARAESDADVIAATFTDTAPTIDGRLTDAVWGKAEASPPFVERKPDPGTPPSDATTFRVLVSHDHVYIGVRAADRRPSEIRRLLSRRDTVLDSDRVTVYLDPLRTGQRAFFFTVTAAGILADGVVYNQTQEDLSWDAIWEGAATTDAEGWSAELAIPLITIPFQDATEQTWGFYVERFMSRNQETSGFPAVPPRGNAFVSEFGALTDLREMRRPASLRLQPYAAAGIQLEEPGGVESGSTLTPNAGLDLQFSPTPRLRFVLALNPDFGEVDQDPEVVNLGPTEVFLAERRPFFSSGLDLFRTPSPPSKAGRFLFLNTRRMGGEAPSSRFGTNAVVVRADTQRRIVGALTALGEVGRDVSVGAMSVVEEPASAIVSTVDPVRGTVVTKTEETAPWTHYGVLRGRHRLGGRSYVGTMATAVNRLDEHVEEVRPSGELTADTDAYVGLVDWELRNDSGGQIVGFLSGSHSRSGDGLGAFLQLGQLGFREWTYKTEVEVYSGGYDVNDLGFMTRADHVGFVGRVDRQLIEPWGSLRSGGVALTTLQSVRFADFSQPLERRLRFDTYATLENNWLLDTAIGYNAPVFDELETRGGPLFPRDEQVRWDVVVETDRSQTLSARLDNRIESEGPGWRFQPTLSVSAVVANRLTMTLSGGWQGFRDIPFFVTTVRDRETPQHIVGDLDFDELELQLNASLGLSRIVTLQSFVQVLWAVGRYRRFEELIENDNGDVELVDTQYLLGEDLDFVRTSLTSNTVLRWDLGGGTAALVSYRVRGVFGRSGSAAPFAFDESVDALIEQGLSHRLLLKISYAWSAL